MSQLLLERARSVPSRHKRGDDPGSVRKPGMPAEKWTAAACHSRAAKAAGYSSIYEVPRLHAFASSGLAHYRWPEVAETARGPRGLRRVSFRTWPVSTRLRRT